MCNCLKNVLMWVIGIVAAIALIFAVLAIILGSFNPGIQAELVDAGGGLMTNNANVLFDTIVNDQSSSISYDTATGNFTVTERGTYLVSWWASPDGAGPATSISFAVAVNGVPYSTASSPIVSVQMSADALVTIDTVPATISLVNVTGDDIFVPDIPVQAGIVITG